MRLPPLQIQLLTEPDPRASAEAGEPRTRPRLLLVTIPPSHTDRGDLVTAYANALEAAEAGGGSALARVYAAVIGLSTRVGRDSRVDFGACNCNVLVYGGRILDWLHDQGALATDIANAGAEITSRIIDTLAPSADEVAAAEKNSAAREGVTT